MQLKNTKRIGLGCMNLSHGYGIPPQENDAIQLLNTALDMGYDHFDTAALYGFGANETLIGKALAHRRNEFFLASKCVLIKGEDGKRAVDGRPEVIKQTCEAALKRLNTDFIDLYYLHRYDKSVPLEDSMGAMIELVNEGKIGSIGMSEVSADTLSRAHAMHPISAVQTEYSLWTRNADIAVIDRCKELDVTFVAFSPLARGYLSGELTDVTNFSKNDVRKTMPRFEPENYKQNLTLLEPFKEMSSEIGATPSQVALAWILKRDSNIVAIPGTTNPKHLVDNYNAMDVTLSDDQWRYLDKLINDTTVKGQRYSESAQSDVDTEVF